MTRKNKTGLYIHIPFCENKCNYCDFYSLGGKCKEDKKEYITALTKNMELIKDRHSNRCFDTVFIGGGTPSIIEAEEISRLFDSVYKCFDVDKQAEITIECNPGTLTEEKLRIYRELGINRLSIGLQTTSDENLKILGRIHSLQDFIKSYEIARKSGFNNINIDMMYALPNQDLNQFGKDVDIISGLTPEHISAYCLKIEENTPFFEKKGLLNIPNEDIQAEMYDYIDKKLNKYNHYEISNFAKSGFECKHNLKYWNREEYLGLGPSAHSYIDNERYFYGRSVDNYIGSIYKNMLPAKISESDHVLSEEEETDEYTMLKLRLSKGVDTEEFYKKFGKDFLLYYEKAEKYVQNGYMIKSKNSIHFSNKGFFVSNFILSDMLKTL